MRATATFGVLLVVAVGGWAASRGDGRPLGGAAAQIASPSSFRPEGDAWTLIRPTFAVKVERRDILFTPLATPNAPGPSPDRPRRFPRPARLELITMARGSVDLAAGSSPAASLKDGAPIVVRGLVVESHAGTDAGLETSWALADRPAGEGEVILRVRVEGAVVARVAKDGLHFFDPRRQAGLAISAPAWTDARGTRSELLAQCERGVIEVRVPSALVDESAYPAALSWLVRPETAGISGAPAPRVPRPSRRRAGGRTAREEAQR